MMYERYSGSFLSVSGVEWKAMILQEADSPSSAAPR